MGNIFDLNIQSAIKNLLHSVWFMFYELGTYSILTAYRYPHPIACYAGIRHLDYQTSKIQLQLALSSAALHLYLSPCHWNNWLIFFPAKLGDGLPFGYQFPLSIFAVKGPLQLNFFKGDKQTHHEKKWAPVHGEARSLAGRRKHLAGNNCHVVCVVSFVLL